jgi:hypothetical protein
LDWIFDDPADGIPDLLHQPFLLQDFILQAKKSPTPNDGRGAQVQRIRASAHCT